MPPIICKILFYKPLNAAYVIMPWMSLSMGPKLDQPKYIQPVKPMSTAYWKMSIQWLTLSF